MIRIISLLRFKGIRRLERTFDPETLHRLLRPIACVRAALKKNPPPLQLPAAIGPGTIHAGNATARKNYYLNFTLSFFPERLADPAWLGRCSFYGIEALRECQRRGQPAIIAICHFGPVYLLSRWLQAAGIRSATFVSGRTDERSYLNRLKDQATVFPEIPRVFFPHQLRELTKFLADGHVLVIAIDSLKGNLIEIPVDAGCHFRMATGAIRLAARHGARLFPGSIRDEGRWRFHFELGRPVPAEWLADDPDLISAGKHLVSELLPHFQAHPGQCSKMVLECFQPVDALIVARKSSPSESVLHRQLSRS
jgi:hypothetical protein